MSDFIDADERQFLEALEGGIVRAGIRIERRESPEFIDGYVYTLGFAKDHHLQFVVSPDSYASGLHGAGAMVNYVIAEVGEAMEGGHEHIEECANV